MNEEPELLAETKFNKYKTNRGSLSHLLRKARTEGYDYPPYRKVKINNSKNGISRYYDPKDVFAWAKASGIKRYRTKSNQVYIPNEATGHQAMIRLQHAREIDELNDTIKTLKTELQCGPTPKLDLLGKAEILSMAKSCNKVGGVYFLIDKEEIVYIGMSINITARIATHQGEQEKIFDKFAFVEIYGPSARTMEVNYIKKYTPKYNKEFTFLCYDTERSEIVF